LSNSLRLLLDTRDQSLLGLPLLYSDDSYRERLARNCLDPVVKFFWQHKFTAYNQRQRTEMLSPIENKIGVLMSNPFIRSILGQNTATLDIPRVMNEGKVLIVNLSKGNLGTEPAHLLGALLISAFAQAAEARRNIPEPERRDFTLFVDEFGNFATDSFASILSESRKWRLSLVAASQFVSQLSEPLQHAVFGNVGTLVAFRVGALDAPNLARELGLTNPRALQEAQNFHAWLRLMHQGSPMQAHKITTLAPPPPGKQLAKVIAFARGRHMIPREIVDERIAKLFACPPLSRGARKARRRHVE